MNTLKDDQVFYAFSPELEPKMSVAQNESFVLETCDCFANQLTSNDDTLDVLDWNRINPATGPVYIEGVKPGDIVRIDIKDIELTGKSVMITMAGAGAISGITKAETTVMENADGFIHVPTAMGDLKLPHELMIGVIGLVPAEGSIPNGNPGKHGGNLDCNLNAPGASLYIEASVDGGLFGCGDVHALMGDGEVLVCGAETPARITLSTSVVDQPNLPTPFIENDDVYATVATAPTSDEAYKMAIDNMFYFLTEIAGLPDGDAGRLMSLVGDLKFCQVVDPEITIRFEFPKSVLEKLGYSGLPR
jgi:amidase